MTGDSGTPLATKLGPGADRPDWVRDSPPDCAVGTRHGLRTYATYGIRVDSAERRSRRKCISRCG